MCPRWGDTACDKLQTSQHILLILQRRRLSAGKGEGRLGGTGPELQAPRLCPCVCAEGASRPIVFHSAGRGVWVSAFPPALDILFLVTTAPPPTPIPAEPRHWSPSGSRERALHTRALVNSDTHLGTDSHMEHTPAHMCDTLLLVGL